MGGVRVRMIPALMVVAWCGAVASGQGRPAEAGHAAEAYASQVARSALRERAIELLVKATLDPEPVLRAHAIEGLHAAPARVEDAVRAGLTDENAGVRFVAASSVGKLKLRKSASFVEPLLGDREPRVRAAAIFALSACGREVDPTPLASMLQEADPLIRSEAARVLGEMGDASAVPMLKAAAAQADSRNRRMFGGSMDERLVQSERVFQLQVAEALVRLGEASAADALRAALYPASREGFESAALAAQILGTLKEQKAVAQLVELVEQRVPEASGEASGKGAAERPYLQPREVRLAAAGALARMGYPDGMYVAHGCLADGDQAVRSQAVHVLGLGKRRSDLPALEGAMTGDPSPMVRVSAAAAVLRSLSERGG